MNPPDTLAPWLAPLGWLALEATAVVLAVLAVQPFLRTAAARRSLWRAALLALVAVLAAELTGTGSQLPAQFRLAWQTTFPKPAPPIPPPIAIPLIEPPDSTPITYHPFPIPAAEAPAPLPFSPEPLPEPPPAPSLHHSITPSLPPPPPPVWPAGIWLAGLVALLMRAAWTHAGFAWLRLRHFIPAAEALRQRAQSLATRLGLRRRVRVLASERLRAPAAFGWVRPGVGVPGDFTARFAPAQQDVMLAHELAHLAARDPLWQLLADLVTAALWWHPLAWVARRQHRIAGELAADDASQALPDGPVVLAECLLALGHEAAAAPRAALGMAGFRSQLGRRVERLVALPHRDWQAPSRLRLALQTTVALLALAALALLPGCAANRTVSEAPSGIVAKWWQAKDRKPEPPRTAAKERSVETQDFGTTIFRLFNERRQPANANSPARLAELENQIAAMIVVEVARLRAEFTAVCAKLPTDLDLLRMHLEKVNQSLKQLVRAANTNTLESDQRHMDVMQRYREEVENILKVEELDRAIPRSATQGRVLFNGTPPAERDIPLPILGAATTRLQEVEQARKQKIAAFEQAGAEYKRLVESVSDPNVSVQERDQRKQAAEAKLRNLQKIESNIAESDRATRFLLGEQVRIRAKAVLTTRFHRVSPDGGLADVLVYVKEGLPSVSFPAPTNPHVIRIQGYEYQPYITAVQTGQPIRWETDVNLNFHPTPTNPANREFNRVLMPGRPVEATFTAPEFFLRTKDDVHPSLFGYVSVLPHPYFAVTDAEGRFRFPRPLPPGKYTLAAVHRQAGESVQELDLTQPLPAGQPPEIEFILSTKPVASYVVAVGDRLRVEVYQRDDLRTDVRVQPDGTILLPLVKAVQVAGKTIAEVRDAIRQAYEPAHLEAAHVTVILVESSPPLAPPSLLSTPKQAPDFALSQPPTRAELLERKARVEAEIKEAEKTYRPSHPKMIGLRKQLETVEEALRQQALVAREFEFVSRRLKQVEYVERKLQNPVYTTSERLQFYASVDYEALREAPLVDPLPPGQRSTNGTVIVPRVPGTAAAGWIEVEQQKLNLEQSIKELSRVYRPSHPKMQTLNKQLGAINRLLEEEERKAAAKLKFLKDALQKQQQELLEKKAPVAADVRKLTSPQTPDAKPQTPTVSQSLVTSAATSAPAAKNWTPAQRAILQRLDTVVFPEIAYDGLPLPEVVKMLQQDARKYDPEKKGFNFLLNSAAQPLEAPARIDLNTVLIKVTSVFRGLTLAQVLDLVCKTASEPIQFTVEDYGIVFTPRDRAKPFVAPRLVERPAGVLTPAQRALLQRLDTVVFPEIAYDGLPLPEVIKFLETDGRKHDPEKKGFNFLVNSTGQHGDAATLVDLDVVLIQVNTVLKGLTLAQVLDVICKTADVRRPDGRNGGLQFVVEDYGIIFMPRDVTKPFVPPRLAERPAGAAVRAALDKTVIPQIAFDRIPLPEVIKMLAQDARQHDPARQGVNLLATRYFPDPPPGWHGLPVGPNGKPLPPLLDPLGNPIGEVLPQRVELPDLDTVIINVPQVLNGLTLSQALDVVCNTASRPITYRVEDYGVLITPKYPVPPAPKPGAPRGALPELEKSRAVVLREIDGVQAKFAIAQRELAAAQRSGPPPEVERCAKVVAELDTRFKAATAELARLEAQLQPKPQASDTVNPGDSLKLLVAEDDSYDAIYPVKRDGSITVKGVGRVSVGGRRLSDAQAAVKALLEETQLPKATVTLELIRDTSGTNTVASATNNQRAIYLAGEFITPGPLKLAEGESLTLTNALLRSGGITPNGDLARVKLLRIENGQGAVEEVNVAAILAGTRPATNHALLPGDIIMVPVRPPVVHVTGSVVKPGPVSLPKDEPLTAHAAILRAGGFAPGASLTNCYIVRDAGNGGKVQIPLSVMGANLALQARDIVVVPGPKAEGKNGVLHEPELKAALQKALGERIGSELANAPLLQPMNPPKPRAAAEALPTNSTTLLHPTNPPKPVQSSTGALPATRAAARQQIAAGNLGEPVKVTLPGSIGEAARTATVQATEVRTVTAPLTPVAADVRRLTSPQTPPASQSLLTSAATNATPAPDPLQAAQEEALRRQERRLVLDRLLGEARQFQKIKSWTNAVVRYEECLLLAPPLNGRFGAPQQVTDAIAGLNYCRLQLAIEHKQRSQFAQATELADKVLALDPANDFARLIKQLVERAAKPTPSGAAVSVDAADQAKAERLIASTRLRLDQNNTRDAFQNLWAALLTNPRSDADSSLLLLLLDKRFEDERVRLAATQWGRVVAVTQKWNEAARSQNGLPVPNPYAKTNSEAPFLTHSSKGAQRINRKLEEIVLPEVHFDAVPLVEVVKWLDVAARNHDPEKKGLNFLINDVAPAAPLLDAAGNPVPVTRPVALSEGLVRVSQPLKNLTLRQALDVICKNAELPTQFSVEEYAIVFIPRGPVAYYSRIFRVSPDAFIQGLQGVVGGPVLGVTSGGANQPGAAGQNQPATTTTTTGPVRATVPATAPATQRTAAEANALVRQFFLSAGVAALGATNGSTRVFFNPENGLLVARGTTNDLRVIEQAIQKVQPSATPPPTGPESRAPERDRPGRSSPASTNAPTSSTPSAPAKPVVKIETRIFERAEPFKNLSGVSLANTLRLDMPGLFTNQVVRAADIRSQFWPPLTTNQLPADGRMEVELYEARTQLAVVMSEARREALLKSLAAGREWKAPDIRLRDGQQGQAQSVEGSTVIIGTPSPANPGANVVSVTTGVTVDLWPKLSADSTSLQLGYVTDVREFLGYAHTTKNPPEAVPRFRVRQAIGTNTLAVGESLLLTVAATVPPPGAGSGPAPAGAERTLFVLLTATLDEPGAATPERDRPGRGRPASTNAPASLPPGVRGYYRTNSEAPFLTHSSKGAQRISRKLDEIILPEIHFDNVSLPAVVTWLDGNVKKSDPEKKGLNFLINNVVSDYISPKAAAPLLDPMGNPIVSTAAKPPKPDLENALIKVPSPIKALTLRQALDAICMTALVKLPNGRTAGLKYSVEEYAVVFSPKLPESPSLFPRMFKVDPATFIAGLGSVVEERQLRPGSRAALDQALREKAWTNAPAGTNRFSVGGVVVTKGSTGVVNTNVTAELNHLVRLYFTAAGVVNLGSTNSLDNTQVFFNDRNGLLLVRASLQDLDIIQQAVELLNVKPQRVKFDVTAFETGPTTERPAVSMRVVTAEEAKAITKRLLPTASRQSDLAVTVLMFQSARVPLFGQGNTNGPSMQVLPISEREQGLQITVRTDHASLPRRYSGINTNARDIYDYVPVPGQAPPQGALREDVEQPVRFVTVPFGHVVVVTANTAETGAASGSAPNAGYTILLTPSIVSPAGSRVHTDEVMPFAPAAPAKK